MTCYKICSGDIETERRTDVVSGARHEARATCRESDHSAYNAIEKRIYF